MSKALKKFYVFLVFVFMYAPIVVLMVYSFNDSRSSSAVWRGFTFDWYVKMASDAQMMKALQTTLIIAISSAVIATLIGTLAAIGIHNMEKDAEKHCHECDISAGAQPRYRDRYLADAAVRRLSAYSAWTVFALTGAYYL